MRKQSILITSIICLTMVFTTVFASFADTTVKEDASQTNDETVKNAEETEAEGTTALPQTQDEEATETETTTTTATASETEADNNLWFVEEGNNPTELDPSKVVAVSKNGSYYVMAKTDCKVSSNSVFTKVGKNSLQEDTNTEALSSYSEGEYSFYKLDTAKENLNIIKVTVGTGETAKTYSFEVKAQTGWVDQDGKKYYYKEDGTKYVNTFASIQGKTYNFDPDGALLYGVNKYKNGSYYFSKADGEVVTEKGYVTAEDGNQYYVLKGGKLVRGTIYSKHYYDSSCKMVKRTILNYKGNLYFIDCKGVIKTTPGWATMGGIKYRAKKGGILYRYTKVKIGAYYYIFDSKGKRLDGRIIKYKGNSYYAWSDGRLKTSSGWLNVNGKKYCVSTGGAFYHNRFVSGSGLFYYLNTDGSVVKYPFKYKGYTLTPNQTTGAISKSEYNKARVYEIKARANAVLSKIGRNLKAAYNWAASLRYYRFPSNPFDGEKWYKSMGFYSDPTAAYLYFTKMGFDQRKGNCYVMAATFYAMAKAMGYNVKLVKGYVYSSGRYWPHCWCTINGYVYDPNFTNERHANAYKIKYGQRGTWKYANYRVIY